MRNEMGIAVAEMGERNETSFSSVPDFEALFRQHQRAVYGWILRIVRDPAAAEDLTLETFWRVYRNLARYDAGRRFEPWVRRIATRAALDWLRGQRERAEPEDFFARMPLPGGDDRAEAAEVRAKVAFAFGRLPAKLRAAATLSLIEELPQKEIAAALGITVGAVKLRVFRAMRLLRKELLKEGIRP